MLPCVCVKFIVGHRPPGVTLTEAVIERSFWRVWLSRVGKLMVELDGSSDALVAPESDADSHCEARQLKPADARFIGVNNPPDCGLKKFAPMCE